MGLFRRDQRAVEPVEVRDPKAATVRLQWSGNGQPQVPLWNAERAVDVGYLGNVVAARCIDVISETVSRVPFRAGAEAPSSPTGIAPFNPNARLAQLLGEKGRPCEMWDAAAWWAWTAAQRIITGRNGSEIEGKSGGGTGEIVALWPLVSAALDAIPSKGGTKPFSSFKYGPASEKKPLSVDQVFYGWDPHPADFRQAKSKLMAASRALNIALQSSQYADALFRNGAIPEYLLVIPEFATPEAQEAFVRQWGGVHQGAGNAGKTQFFTAEQDADGKLSEAVAVHKLGMTPKDSRLIEQHKAALEEVAIALGVPWSLLDASGRTFDNASQEGINFWETTIIPLLTKLAGEVNRSIAPRLGREVGWFDLSDVQALRPSVTVQESILLADAGYITAEELRLRAGFTGPAPELEDVAGSDPVTAKVGAPSLLQAKLMTINEARTDLGLDPVPDGDRFLTDEEILAAKSLGGGESAVRSLLDRIESRTRRALPPAPVALPEARATDGQEARRGAIWRSTDAVITAHEAAWTRAWRRLFARQEEAVLGRLTGARGRPLAAAATARVWADEKRGPADGVFDPAFWRAEAEEMAAGLFETLAGSAFARLSGHFGVSFDLESEFAQLFITSRSNQLAGQVTDTTYSAITDQLAEGVAAGESIPDLAARIREVFADARGNRATVIARTEVISGHNAAALSAASSLPADVVAAQQWIATRDGRTRPTHAEADGQTVAVGQPFSVGGVGAAYPGDPGLPAGESVQCRCTVAFLTPDEFVAEADAWTAAAAAVPVPVERARVALALVGPGEFDEARFRRAIEVAA